MKDGGSRVARATLWGVLAAIVLGVVVLLARGKPAAQTPPAAEQPVAVRVQAVAPGAVADTLTIPGRIVPAADIALAIEKAGTVVDLPFDKGAAVRRGDLLMRVDSRLWEVALDRAKIEKRDAERELRRWEQLQPSGAVSDSDLDRIRLRMQMATASLAEAEINVEKCALCSPTNAVIEDRMVELGEHVGDGDRVFRLVVIDELKVRADVPEKDAASVRPGDTAAFSVASLGGESFTGRVSFVAAAGNPASNAYAVELRAANPGGRLKAGMIVSLALQRAALRDAILVPLTAVVPTKRGEHLAYVVRDGRAESRVLTLERIVGSNALISAGLAAGDQLVVEGQRTLQDGLPVQVAP